VRFARISISTSGTGLNRGSSYVLALLIALMMLLLPPALVRPSQAADADAFPITLVDDEGSEVVIEAFPERIISLSPANTETVYALGGGDRLVGGTDFDDFPPEAADLADVASFNGVIMERVVDLDPDLVLAAGNSFTPAGDIARMRELGYPVVVVYAPDVEGVLSDIELIGAAIGEAGAGATIASRMRAEIETISAAAAAVGSRPRTFYQIGSEPEIYGPAPESFVADMVALAGGDPITTSDRAVFSIPVEELLVADPEVIVVGDANYGVCPADVAARPAWTGMSAVVDGAVRPVDDVPVTRPGPRLPAGLASLARAIHPALVLEGYEPDPELCAG